MKFIFFVLCTFSLFGLELKHCWIKDPVKHAANQELLSAIIDQELSNCAEGDKACYLFARVYRIADALLKSGFAADAYALPVPNEGGAPTYTRFALWEGEEKNIPMTFFAYVWPSEEFAMQCGSVNFHATAIHSHPIPCAFAVLEGALVEQNYELISGKNVRMTGESVLHTLEGSVDDLGSPFIHRVFCRGTPRAISLHMYGLSTAEKVVKSFQKHCPDHQYVRCN